MQNLALEGHIAQVTEWRLTCWPRNLSTWAPLGLRRVYISLQRNKFFTMDRSCSSVSLLDGHWIMFIPSITLSIRMSWHMPISRVITHVSCSWRILMTVDHGIGEQQFQSQYSKLQMPPPSHQMLLSVSTLSLRSYAGKHIFLGIKQLHCILPSSF